MVLWSCEKGILRLTYFGLHISIPKPAGKEPMSHVTRVMVAFLFVTISLFWAVPSLALVTCSTSTMGGGVSEAIIIPPAGAGNGLVIVTNSADGDFTINDEHGVRP